MFWGNRNFLYLVLCGGYMDVKSYQKVIKQHGKICVVCGMLIIVQLKDKY